MDRDTIGFYDSEARTYASYLAETSRAPRLEHFAALLPAGGAVLDFGCGSAWAAARLRDLGFAVSATDGSAGLAAEAKARYGIDVTVAPFEALADVAAYDGIWASFCLLHDTREAMPRHLARLSAALRPGGAFYIGLKAGTGAKRDKLGRLYTYFDAGEMAGYLETAGFAMLETQSETGTSYDGTPDDFLHIYARKPA